MTAIVSGYPDLNMSNFSLSFLLPQALDNSFAYMSSYADHKVTFGGLAGGHESAVVYGDFPEQHDTGAIPGDAIIAGFQISSAGSLGSYVALSVDGISITWSDLTTTKDALTKDGPVSFSGSMANEIAVGSAETDVFNMRGGKDQVYAGDSFDEIHGGTGADHLDGGPGNDTIDGGRGRDDMIGGAGDDYFTFFGKSGHDTIEDYQSGDLLEFAKSDVRNGRAFERDVTQVGADVHIDIHDAMSIILKNAHVSDLNFMIANY